MDDLIARDLNETLIHLNNNLFLAIGRFSWFKLVELILLLTIVIKLST